MMKPKTPKPPPFVDERCRDALQASARFRAIADAAQALLDADFGCGGMAEPNKQFVKAARQSTKLAALANAAADDLDAYAGQLEPWVYKFASAR